MKQEYGKENVRIVWKNQPLPFHKSARPAAEAFVGSSIQFCLPDWSGPAISAFVLACKGRGVELKWFGAPRPAGFTSRYDHWGYAEPSVLPKTDRVLAGLLDMRLPLTFSLEDCARIARIVRAEIALLQPGNRTAASQGAA